MLLASCADDPGSLPAGTPVAHGAWLFAHSAASPSTSNAFACATCHPQDSAVPVARVWPGALLAGATQRKSFWGGQMRDLLPAINACRFWFMDAQKPWLATDEAATAMWAYLDSLPATLPGEVSFSVVGPIADLSGGDPGRGAALWPLACGNCHGAVHTGKGRLTALAPLLPEQFVKEHSKYTPAERRLVCIEKIRHGPFLGYGGRMPPFSREALSDAQVADLVAFLGL